MARRNRRPLVPEAREALNQMKVNVMKQQGYQVDDNNPDQVKYEVSKEVNVPLQHGYNGSLTSKEAGKVGGPIGGNMVKEMIKMAQEQMKNQKR
ncbi:Small, acid-soluble spore protein, alpha/beta type [Mesobacillus persicus]|uniref:Small, acid-soluble spore protein, alpha/beta type n=1 Tax=Mesobacillus persicus TaxID=930146 RepID=A0A1H8A272_9BACI|nr:alpha/beta-type small acid-soluble spore protein [Mesobacillus persicus]SEM64810.1 Small, acid-soluble spore protein, alpha/beta type [Mesobacillus persicus]